MNATCTTGDMATTRRVMQPAYNNYPKETYYELEKGVKENKALLVKIKYWRWQ